MSPGKSKSREVIVDTECGISAVPVHADDADGGEERGSEAADDDLETPSHETQDTGVSDLVHASAVAFDDGTDGATAATTESMSGRRKVEREDVRNIFRASQTTGTVPLEQMRRIKRMHDKIADGVDFNFNYYTLLMIASVVAGLCLATGSSTTVISSMLLSPIMGPVIGMSYGLVIWDLRLIKRSIRNELISIVMCVLFGLIIGAACQWTRMAEHWPTKEMLSRGSLTTFLAGFPIAFFSGLGVALSVLDDSTSSLVGVAISASLLPPAVNCGMMFIVAFIKDEKWTSDHLDLFERDIDHATHNFAHMAVLSLLLTVANVIMVAIGATLVFRIKEVLPVEKKVFWDDLKIARRIVQGRAIDSFTGEALSRESLGNQR